MSPFDEAFMATIISPTNVEGGYVNHPEDPGGETKFGISKRAYPSEDIANLTVERAKYLYKRDYWDKCRCGDMPWPISYLMFDTAIHSGVGYAIKLLQRILGVTIDGVIGPKTIGALKDRTNGSVWLLGSEYMGARMFDMTSYGGWAPFGRGWCNRMMKVMFKASGKLA